MNKHHGVYCNNKTKELYIVINTTINCDNGSEGKYRIEYRKLDYDGKDFSRDESEFLEKFTYCHIRKPIEENND